MSIIKDKIEKADVLALLGYSVLTAILTYPVILKMNYIAGNDPDVYPFLWVLWWVKKAILELHTTPYFSRFIFYPSGVNLAFHPLIFSNSIISIPLQFFFSIVVTYNILFLLTFVLSGFGTYLLVKYLTKDETAAFIAGVIFAFSPFRFAHALGHFTTITTQWIPFYVLFLIKTVNEKTLKNAIITAVFLVLVALSSWYFMMFAFIFTVIYLCYYGIVDKKRIIKKEFGKRFFLGILLFTLLITPFVFPMLKTVASESYMKKPIDSTFIMSADIFSFVVPPSFHPVFGGLVKGIYSRFTGNPLENNLFVGYTVLLLGVYALKEKKRNREVRFWAISAFVFFILCLGPALHIMGRFIFPSPIPLGGIARKLGIESSPLGKELLEKYVGIPLPYLFLYLFMPFFSVSRTPARFGIMVMLSMAVLVSYGITELFKIVEGRKFYGHSQKTILTIILLIVILFEFLAVPFPVTSASVPEFYHQISKDKSDYAIVEVPLEATGGYMYYSTIHKKRVLWAYLARYPPESKKFVNTVPLLKKFQCKEGYQWSLHEGLISATSIANPGIASISEKIMKESRTIYSESENQCKNLNITKDDIKILQNNRIKYIVIHKGSYSKSGLQELNILLEVLDDDEPVYEDGDLRVYGVY